VASGTQWYSGTGISTTFFHLFASSSVYSVTDLLIPQCIPGPLQILAFPSILLCSMYKFIISNMLTLVTFLRNQ
jgi:hypothetical protein